MYPGSPYAAACRGAGHADRCRTQDPEETHPRGQDPYRDRVRAQIVLAAARGRANAPIAAELGVSTDMVRKWRGRFAARPLDGLADLPRSGRPRPISAAERAAVVALACQLPAVTGVPLSRWTGPELAAELAAQGLAGPISVSSDLRILAEHPVKPWQYQSWISPRDPDFEAKAKVILDLYQGFYGSEPLRPGDRFLWVHAKPSIQARGRGRSSRLTTSQAWTSCPPPCSPSPAATTRTPARSTGNSLPATSPPCSAGLAHTIKPATRQQADLTQAG